MASEKEPKSIKEGSGTKISQQQLFELWSNAPDAKDNKLTKDKTFVLGSKVNFLNSYIEPIDYTIQGACQLQHGRHWLLRHSPDSLQQPLGPEDHPGGLVADHQVTSHQSYILVTLPLIVRRLP